MKYIHFRKKSFLFIVEHLNFIFLIKSNNNFVVFLVMHKIPAHEIFRYLNTPADNKD